MAHYLVFIPNATGDVKAALKRVGLESLLREDDFPPDATHNVVGPNKLTGMMVTWLPGVIVNGQTEYPAWEFSQDKHRAIACPPDPDRGLPGARYWYIDEPARPVRPSDLKRKPADDLAALLPTKDDNKETRQAKLAELDRTFAYPGKDVDLLKKSGTWHVANQFRLPASYALDDSGKFANVVRPEFRSVYDRMLWAYQSCVAQIQAMWLAELGTGNSELGTPKDIEPRDAFEYCVDVLALNYRINTFIAGQLGLVGPDNFWRVMVASTDAFRINSLLEDLRKKKEAISSSGSTSFSGTAAS